jgi:hypothetical protein
MISLRRVSVAIAAMIAGLFVVCLSVQGQPTQKPAGLQEPRREDVPEAPKTKEEVDKWMLIKLKASQEIFAGLTNGESKKIENNARRMLVINVLEQWRRDNDFAKTSEYEAQLNAFEYATKELIRTSHHEDIDGALDAYIRLSQSCVKCHQLIRDVPAKNQ